MKILTPTGALRAWWAVLMVLTAGLLASLASVAVTLHAERQHDREWCDLLVILDAPAQRPTTPRGAVIQQRIHERRVQLGCPASLAPPGG